jgi:hypothetical protein
VLIEIFLLIGYIGKKLVDLLDGFTVVVWMLWHFCLRHRQL